MYQQKFVKIWKAKKKNRKIKLKNLYKIFSKKKTGYNSSIDVNLDLLLNSEQNYKL